MQNPVVSLNEMAMNESVAATCCFVAANINGHDYETVLNGGYLTDRVTNEIVYGVDTSWVAVLGDYSAASATNPLYSKYVNGEWLLGAMVGEEFVTLDKLAVVSTTNPDLTYCDHKGDYCHYVTAIDPVFSRVHVGSTVEHTSGGKKWSEVHNAIRFSS